MSIARIMWMSFYPLFQMLFLAHHAEPCQADHTNRDLYSQNNSIGHTLRRSQKAQLKRSAVKD